MTFAVLVAPSAAKDLAELPSAVHASVIAALRSLASNPFPSGSKKLAGSAHNWRLRVRDYRALYTVDSSSRTVRVFRIKHRREAYR